MFHQPNLFILCLTLNRSLLQPQLLAAVKFIAHLVNQQIVHELIALELLTVLLEKPTDDSVEVAVGFVTECGSMLQDLCPRGLHGECTLKDHCIIFTTYIFLFICKKILLFLSC